MKTGSTLAIVAFLLVALAHFARLVSGLPVTVGTTDIPMLVSVGGVVIPAALAVMLWRESRAFNASA